MGLFKKRNDVVYIAQRCAECTSELKMARNAASVRDCISYWDSFQSKVKSLDEYLSDHECPKDALDLVGQIMDISSSEREYQKILRSAIEHQGRVSQKAVEVNLRDSISRRVDLYLDLSEEFNHYKEDYSEETLDFAQRILDMVFITVGQEFISRQIILPEWKEVPELPDSKNPEQVLNIIDKMNGTAFELFCAELLKDNGFINVELTAKTGDQGVDIIAEKDSVRYAVQCKCYESDLGNTSIQEVYAGKEMYGCHVGVVLTNRYFTKGAIELAEKTHVLLWDRDTIKKMIMK